MRSGNTHAYPSRGRSPCLWSCAMLARKAPPAGRPPCCAFESSQSVQGDLLAPPKRCCCRAGGGGPASPAAAVLPVGRLLPVAATRKSRPTRCRPARPPPRLALKPWLPCSVRDASIMDWNGASVLTAAQMPLSTRFRARAMRCCSAYTKQPWRCYFFQAYQKMKHLESNAINNSSVLGSVLGTCHVSRCCLCVLRNPRVRVLKRPSLASLVKMQSHAL